MLSHARQLASREVLKSLYYAHIYPHLYYCSPIWATTYPTHLTRLISIQKRAIRIITSSDFLGHTSPLFRETNILKIQDIYKKHIANKLFSDIQSNTVHINYSHTYHTRYCQVLAPPPHRLSLFKHSYVYQRHSVYNLIPSHIKDATTQRLFINKFRSFITSNY